ncbi:hypothetical protein [Allokutzneria oryzae]|uniref:Lipoprotein n=1 Tax=Allokutzneria oryzae TaxID=1378989 RepID=A0ABV5ZZW1_9PSEU
MRRERRRLWPALGALALILPVPACSSGAARCEEALTAATTSVPGVVSAQWECSNNFGGGWQRAHVVIEAATETEAIAVVDAALRAYATALGLEDGWSTPQEYATRDRSIIVSANDVGFNGPPNIREVRERYGTTSG